MPISFEFDYLKPNYGKVFQHRIRVLEDLQQDENAFVAIKAYYKAKPWQFINDWGVTFDPRNADIGLPTTLPFILFDRQEEWCKWLLNHWRNREPGLTEKSRDMGVTWLAVAMACTICIFYEGVAIGFGSRKLDLVDKIGNPDSIFWKARMFLKYIPAIFLNKFDAPYCRIQFSDTGSVITGEGGDGIGRGGRQSIYFVDESAHIEHPSLVDASLSNTTNCRIDVTSANGMANSFAQKRFSGKIDVFTFHWRSDPRKNPENKFEYPKGSSIMRNWYESKEYDLDPVTMAQEIDINYHASVEGMVIPAAWVSAAIDADIKLGIEVTGAVSGALDVADQGIDNNAIAIKYGIKLIGLKEWSGKGSDTLYTAERAFEMADEFHCPSFQYDADGIGASIRGDSRLINERRKSQHQKVLEVVPFRGSAEVFKPDGEMVKGRKNKDYFLNRKSQSWWYVRLKFRNTFRAINGEDYDKEELISISSKLSNLAKLQIELSQPTYTINTTGKIVIDKAPDNTRSPNLADGVMILYSPPKRSVGLFG